MSKSKAEILKEKLGAVIDRCEKAGNEKAAEVYKGILKKKIEELQKKSVDDLPDLKKEALEAKGKVNAMLEAIAAEQKELDGLASTLVTDQKDRQDAMLKVIGDQIQIMKRDQSDQSEVIQESIDDLAVKQEALNFLVGETIGDLAIIQEIATELINEKE